MKKIIIKKILQYLYNQSKGVAESSKIIEDLSLEISMPEYDELIREMENRGLLDWAHKQTRTYSKPTYDQIMISNDGREYLKSH